MFQEATDVKNIVCNFFHFLGRGISKKAGIVEIIKKKVLWTLSILMNGILWPRVL